MKSYANFPYQNKLLFHFITNLLKYSHSSKTHKTDETINLTAKHHELCNYIKLGIEATFRIAIHKSMSNMLEI